MNILGWPLTHKINKIVTNCEYKIVNYLEIINPSCQDSLMQTRSKSVSAIEK